MFDYSWISCAMLMECGSELRGGTVLGLNRRQGYKREGQTHMLTVGGTRGPGRLPPREDGGDQMQLLSEPALAESGSALKRVFECVVAIFFSEPSPCSEAEAGFWNPVLNRTAPLNSPPPHPHPTMFRLTQP